jgi:hypothetical protein
MTEPERAAWLWLALAVATLWMVSSGSGVEESFVSCDSDLPNLHAILGPTTRRPRRTRLVRLGCLWLLVRLITAQPLPLPQRLVPEPWPEIPQRVEFLMPHQQAVSYVPA